LFADDQEEPINMKWLLSSLIFLVSTLAFAQKQVAPPPKPADDGPSIEVTMKFIEDKLNAVGTINFILYLHDGVTGIDWSNKRSWGISNVVADPNTCFIKYHYKWVHVGQVVKDNDITLGFKWVKNIAVTPVDLLIHNADVKAGHPERSIRSDPPVFALVAKFSNGNNQEFDFYDESMANRVAKAMARGAEICGGGSKALF
jgi:hypothetical protein